MKCDHCGITEESTLGGWCDPCWEVAKAKVLEKFSDPKPRPLSANAKMMKDSLGKEKK